MARFSTTLRALAAPRRSLPIAGVVAVLLAVQAWYGGGRASLVPLAMSLGFVLLAPWSWRALLAERATAARFALYLAGGLAMIVATGVAWPRLLGLEHTFLTDAGSLAISLVLYLVGGWGLGRDLELEQSLEHLRLQAVRAHLDPHFLANTLNAIAEWCREDAAVAEQATLRAFGFAGADIEGLPRAQADHGEQLPGSRDRSRLHGWLLDERRCLVGSGRGLSSDFTRAPASAARHGTGERRAEKDSTVHSRSRAHASSSAHMRALEKPAARRCRITPAPALERHQSKPESA